MRVEIVRKPAEQHGFAVHPKRWVVERSLAWLTAHRRLVRDYERDPAVSEAFIGWAAINTMVRRLDRSRPATRQASGDQQSAGTGAVLGCTPVEITPVGFAAPADRSPPEAAICELPTAWAASW
jgi:hypothetical protein